MYFQLCMQETQIHFNIDHNLPSFPGYTIEKENNSSTARTAIYISNKIKYICRGELEGQELGAKDARDSYDVRIINLYSY